MLLAEQLRVTESGRPDGQPMVFVHGFGCAQEMWRQVAPAFESSHRVVLFDLPGSGGADPATYDPARHTTLAAYADDVIALLRELELTDVVLVGHSVSAMIVALVQIQAPELVDSLVLTAPSARYVNDGAYVGGFEEAAILELLDLMDRNHLGWQAPLAGLVAGTGPGEVQHELEDSFCRAHPEVAAQFARVTFLSDNRDDLPRISAPTLVLQSSDDDVAPLTAGAYVRDHIEGAQMVVIETRGHCPHMTAPEQTERAIYSFLAGARV